MQRSDDYCVTPCIVNAQFGHLPFFFFFYTYHILLVEHWETNSMLKLVKSEWNYSELGESETTFSISCKILTFYLISQKQQFGQLLMQFSTFLIHLYQSPKETEIADVECVVSLLQIPAVIQYINDCLTLTLLYPVYPTCCTIFAYFQDAIGCVCSF